MEKEQKMKKQKKKTKVGAIFYGILMILIYMGTQLIISSVVLVPIIAKSNIAAGGDMEKYQQIYLENIIANSDKIALYQDIASVVSFLIAVILFYFLVYRKNRMQPNRPEGFLKNLSKLSFWGIFVTGMITMTSAVLFLNCLAAWLMPSTSAVFNEVMDVAMGDNPVISLIIVSVLAPIAEEMLLRGVVLNRSKLSFGMAGCVILNAILFGIFHMNPIQFIYVLPMGAFLAYLAYRYNSIIPAIAGHFIHNTFATFVPMKYISLPILLVVMSIGAASFILIAVKNPTPRISDQNSETEEAETCELSRE